MNRNDTQIIHSNRPASRRLHRRLAVSSMVSCVNGLTPVVASPEVISSLPKSVVREAGMFELLAAELRIAELEQALAEAREAAFTDPLTGALNRRGFAKACQREMSRSRRQGSRLALAHIDLDDFKQVNDTLGHQAGDRALVYLVDLLHKSMRPSDVLCRFGGEEFVLMLPETSLENATAALSRFLCEFSAGSVCGTDCMMTFSAGVVVQRDDESMEDALQRADVATYEAKRAGKNRIISS
ncbi:MAG: GGDEF domain-containing protein [Betaproteobacteria bacterium]